MWNYSLRYKKLNISQNTRYFKGVNNMPRTKGAKDGIRGNNINKEQFEKLASMMCTVEEITAFFNIHYDTFNDWCQITYGDTFAKIVKRFHECGKASLRRTQFKIAEKGNANMAIFLGKQYLGQTDKAEQTNIERVAIVSDMPQEDDEE